MFKVLFFFFLFVGVCWGNDILVLTASFGGIDEIAGFPEEFKEEGVDYFFVTESANLAHPVSGWTLVARDFPRGDLNPRMKAKYFKMQAHTAFPGYRVYMWMDSSYRIQKKGHVAWFMHYLESTNTSVAFRAHPQRTTVRDELQFCVEHITETYLKERYSDERMEEQVRYYTAKGFPDTVGLYAGGMFAYINTGRTYHFFDRWWLENIRWTLQDQLSLPYVIWESNINFLALPPGLGNDYIKWVGHLYSSSM